MGSSEVFTLFFFFIMKYCDRALVVSPVYYTLITSEKAYYKELERIQLPKDDFHKWINEKADATTHFFAKGDKRIALVAIKFNKNYDDVQVYSLLTHEAIHLWQYIKSELSESNPSSEFEAYSVQAIVQQLLYKLKKSKEFKKIFK